MAVPQHPAAYLSAAAGAGRPALAAALAQRGWPQAVLYVEEDVRPGCYGPVFGRLEAAVAAGRHDGLLLTLPRGLGDPARLMRLLGCRLERLHPDVKCARPVWRGT